MSATVLDLTARLTHRPALAEQARSRVSAALARAGYPSHIVSEAQARAARNVTSGVEIKEAVRRVLAWASNQIEPTLPPAA